MRHLLLITSLVVALGSGVFLHAEVRAVPGEYATIQAALDALQTGDTVLIAPGTYAEVLRAPALAFWMLGDVGDDTTGTLRPVLDPTPVPGSDSLACLTVPQFSTPVLEDLVFRNGAAMYPRREDTWGSGTGGIASAAELLTARRCLFDSTYNAIHAWEHRVTLSRCVFTDVNFWCVWTSSERLIAEDCDFHGHSEWSLLQFGDSSRLERCRFRNGQPGSDGQLILSSARGVILRDCVFQADARTQGPPLQIGDGTFQILNCVFTGFRLESPLISLNYNCNEPHILRGNLFYNNAIASSIGRYLVESMDGDTASPCRGLIAEDNRFVDNEFCGIICSGNDWISRNRFQNMECAEIRGTFHQRFRPVHFLQNGFDHTGWAVNPHPLHPLRAPSNWWGDATGPYQVNDNPQGQGDTAGVYAGVVPWSTDTLFWTSAPEPRPLKPQQFALAVFPNPFNSVCRVRFEVPEPVIARLELFDLLGRRVQELWVGAVGLDREVPISAAALPAGVYFVRASDTIYGQTLAMAKVVLLK